MRSSTQNIKMTPAEFKTIREFMNLSPSWVAEFLEVSDRAIRHWETGERSVSELVAEQMLTLLDIFNTSIEQSKKEISKLKKGDSLCLVRYRDDLDLWSAYPEMEGLPASFHAGILAHVRRYALSRGITATIRYFDHEAYELWRKSRPDCAATRALWAVEDRAA